MGFYPKKNKDARRDGKPVYIESPTGKRCIGYLITENGLLILQKTLREDKHFCKKHRGWGMEIGALEQLRILGVDLVRVVTGDTKVIEEVSLETFIEHGICDNLGFGLQMFLPRRYFTRRDEGQGTLFGGVAR